MNEGTGSCDWLHSLKSGSKLTSTLNQLKLLAATEMIPVGLLTPLRLKLRRETVDLKGERRNRSLIRRRHTSFQASLLLSSPHRPTLLLCVRCHSPAAPRLRHMALSALLLSYINTVVAGNYRHVGATRWRGCGAATVAGGRRRILQWVTRTRRRDL